MPDLSHGARVLLAAISDVPAGTITDAERLRDTFDAAGLTVAERGGAFKVAARLGYLSAPTLGQPSRIPSRKGGRSCAWVRTGKPVPVHLCEWEVPA